MTVICDAIDISHWQGTIDFSQVKSQVNFVIAKASQGSSSDSMYSTYVSQMKSNNIPFSSYSYFSSTSTSVAQSDAQYFYNTIDSSSICLALDVEEIPSGLSGSLISVVQSWIDKLRSLAGSNAKIGLYSGESFFNTNNLDSVTDIDWIWIAKYGTNDGQQHTKPDVGVPISLWQYTSLGASQISGVSSSGLDLNTITGDDKTLSYFTSSTSTNNPPTVPNYSKTTNYNKSVSDTVIGADTDGDILTYSKYSSPLNGSVTVSSNGSWTYTPNNGYSGTDTFKVKVSDGISYALSTITITVNANNPPTVSDYTINCAYYTTTSGNVDGHDVDGDDLNYYISQSPSNGTVDLTESNGVFTYTPNRYFVGTDTFKVQVLDGNGGSAISTITATVAMPSVSIPTPPSYDNTSYTIYLTINNSVKVYLSNSLSSEVIETIANIYSIVYLEDSSSDGTFGRIKYIDNQNIAYFGYVKLSDVALQEDINNNPPSNNNSLYYTVVDSDSINSIASSLSVTVEQLKLLNGWVNQKSVILTVGEQVRYK